MPTAEHHPDHTPPSAPSAGADASSLSAVVAPADIPSAPSAADPADIPSAPASEPVPVPAPDLDPVIHAASRLRLMTTLAALPPGDRIAFTALARALDMTVGNLSTHLTKLEDAGYAQVTKTFEGKRPATYAELTALGRLAFEHYLTALKQLLGGLT
jgi:DNA-binding transcriptional ArsR family regulator